MKRVVTSKEMKLCDNNTIEYFGVPSLVLMERAALSVTEQAMQRLSRGNTALIVCGNGNNGADGLAAARLLVQRGIQVCVVQAEDNGKRSKENQLQHQILQQYGIPVLNQIPEDTVYHCVIDALFGVGLSRPVKGQYAEWILEMNRLDAFKIAVDVPSGVSSDSGEAYEPSFEADLTVTFAYQKAGQILYPGCAKCGMVKIAEIGITDESWLDCRPSCYTLEQSDLQRLPHRPARSNKGTFGKLLVIAGSKDMAGAALFCAKAAYRTGCGLVKICTPQENRIPLQNALPEAILLTYHDLKCKTEAILEAIKWADVIALGPGIGTGKRACKIVELTLKHAAVPMVIDADGLNIISKHLKLLQHTKAELILTPHLGEMARLTGKQIAEIQNTLLKTATDFATYYRLICVLKDARTVTACADGTAYLNTSGCNAMAKGGSGDVLTGIIAGLLAQGMSARDAASLGVYIHGLSGEEAASKIGNYSVLATDLLDAIGSVMSGKSYCL